MGLLQDFKAAAVERTRFPDNEGLTNAALFALVRDMPFQRVPTLTPEAVVAAWHGTGPGKHVLLQALYEEFGLSTMLICGMHEFTAATHPWLPPHLLAEIEANGPVPDVHMFLRLQVNSDWMTVDATWPLATARLGLPVNERFEENREMELACDPDEVLHVPPQADRDEFYEIMLARHVGDALERRNRFVDELSAWLGTEVGTA
jgi:hypothetical protein